MRQPLRGAAGGMVAAWTLFAAVACGDDFTVETPTLVEGSLVLTAGKANSLEGKHKLEDDAKVWPFLFDGNRYYNGGSAIELFGETWSHDNIRPSDDKLLRLVFIEVNETGNKKLESWAEEGEFSGKTKRFLQNTLDGSKVVGSYKVRFH